MAKQTVALYTVTSGDRVERARSSLAEALGGAALSDPDDAGVFEVSVDAESPDAARDLVREAFARAGAGADFVIRETTEGRELADDDPRQGTEGGVAEPATPAPTDHSTRVADAANAVAAAASGAASGIAGSDAVASAREAAGGIADSDAVASARETVSDAADSAREAVTGAADSVREAVDEKGVAGAASDYAGTAATAAHQSQLKRFAPIGGLLLLLALLRRRRSRG